MSDPRLPESVVDLPVMSVAGDILQALTNANVLLRAEPGAGKSTGLPLVFLIENTVDGKIILLEPRRLAARSVAQRLASHLGEKLGQTIGLRMRSETRVSAATKLEVVTEGVLTRMLQNDPALEGVGLVIFDEFHERSLHADLGLALCLEVQMVLRDDLRLLLMSATLDTEFVSEHLDNVVTIDCPGREHPVELIYLGESPEPLPQRVAATIKNVLLEHMGDVLVFLPGLAEINRTASLLEADLNESSVRLHKLHSGAGTNVQSQAVAASGGVDRRVILSTSIAETSLTIDGVTVVIDSGLERRARIDTSTGAHRLETVTASQASATQRAGRAARTAPGICYRLWSQTAHARRPAQWQPEILRADVSPLLSELSLWGVGSEYSLPWLTPPPAASLSRAQELLVRLGMWEVDRLSAYGRKVASLSVHPRLGHMLLWSAGRGVLQKACRLVALLEEQSLRNNQIDIDTLLRISLNDAMKRRENQYERAVKALVPESESVDDKPSTAVILAQAFPDWIAQRRPAQDGEFLLACGAGVRVNRTDVLAHCQWLVVTHMGGTDRTARVFRATALDIDELERFSPQLFGHVDYVDWDERQQRVIAEHRKMIGSLLVQAQPIQKPGAEQKAAALLQGIRRQGLQCLPWTAECREWLARVQRMSTLSVSGQINNWPKVDEETLLESLESWLLPWLSGLGSMKAIQQIALHDVLNAMLDYQQRVALDTWLPTRFTVPSGSSIRLSYIQPGNPVLSVRLQEMLGCSDNPAVANGQLPLRIELLSPAMRPIQVTEDLASFWTGSYPAVKKAMAGRYPKHFWPDNPLDAMPTTRAKPRKAKGQR